MGGAWTLGSWLSGDERQIHDKLQERLPHLTVKAVLPTPAQGVYAVETENGEVNKILHATANGSYVIAGDLYEITKEGAVNLTETRREEQRREMLKKVDKKGTPTSITARGKKFHGFAPATELVKMLGMQ